MLGGFSLEVLEKSRKYISNLISKFDHNFIPFRPTVGNRFIFIIPIISFQQFSLLSPVVCINLETGKILETVSKMGKNIRLNFFFFVKLNLFFFSISVHFVNFNIPESPNHNHNTQIGKKCYCYISFHSFMQCPP